ncbi:Spindle and kinetochore-associated protein 1 [Halocaridina rubra]|uniref:SKA complex subunit 1 n=1 Tax=Halocaridina rubra TaxID=373956 RepID=A0AAN9AAK8_HALRR
MVHKRVNKSVVKGITLNDRLWGPTAEDTCPLTHAAWVGIVAALYILGVKRNDRSISSYDEYVCFYSGHPSQEGLKAMYMYIRGRLQYGQINNAINEINKAIETKYALVARPRAKISEFDMKIVTSCRQHENKETKGLYFVVNSDIKRLSNMRLDTAGRTILTILRMLKRLREIRGPGNLIRYVAL